MSPKTTPNLDSDTAPPPGVSITHLENGLTIIVREDHSAPVVSAQAWCMAGSIHEGNRLGAGLSHALEHMLFKGTSHREGKRIDQEVQEAGGYMNAYTSFDRTVYHIDVPNTGAKIAVDILCDIMRHATLPEDEMEKEKQVILREMDMNLDDPGRRASRRLFETAFTRSPYRFTIIGYPDLFGELRREDVMGYYREKYAPNNVFYVVAGDVSAPDVVSQIRAAYSDAKARAVPPMVLPPEPAQTSPREVIEEAPVELGYLHAAWHIPEVRHPDVPVLDVLACLLGNGRSSRLYEEVRQKQGLVHSIDAWTYSPGETGLFGVSALVDPENFTPAREAIYAEVERMRDELVPIKELNKAVKQFLAATLSTRKTMQGQAQELGSNWISATDLNFSRRFLEAVQRTTPADLQRVARQYLTPANRTTYALLPTGSTPKAAAITEVATQTPIKKVELENGLRLLLKEDRRLPFIEIRAVLRGGVLAETEADNGVTQLTAKMLLKGTGRRTAEDIALEAESIGGSIDSYGGNNSLGVNVEVMQGDLEAGLDLIADVLQNPAFDPALLDREREMQLASIRAQRDHLLQSAFQAMRRELFGARGYGLDPAGSEEAVAALAAESVRAFHRRLFVPGNCVLAVYGNVDPAEAQRIVAEKFGRWTPGAAMQIPEFEPQPIKGARRTTEVRDKKQAVIVAGYRGTTLFSPDRYALELVQEACSDLGSRLFLRIREELGLAYYVGAQNVTGLTPGCFAFYAGTAPESAEQVEQEILQQASILARDGLSVEELNRAKAKVVGQRKIARQDLGHLAMSTALDELHGLGFAHGETEDALYEAVTVEQTKTVAAKYLANPDYVLSVIKPA